VAIKGEHQEQKTLFDWIYLNRDYAPNPEVRKVLKLCYAVINGANLPKKQYQDKSGNWKTWSSEGKWLKEEGLTEGMPDVNLDWPVLYVDGNILEYSGLRIEHKYRASISPKIQALIDTGNYIVDLSSEQEEKRELLIEAGYHVVVSYSAVQSIRTIFEYLPFKIEDYQGIREYL